MKYFKTIKLALLFILDKITLLNIISKLSEVNPERDKHCEVEDAVCDKKYPESPGHGGSP